MTVCRPDTKVLVEVLFCRGGEKGAVLKRWFDRSLAGSSGIPSVRAAGRCGYNRPNSRARATASVRLWTWSLPKIFRLCPFTVSRARNSRSLIS